MFCLKIKTILSVIYLHLVSKSKFYSSVIFIPTQFKNLDGNGFYRINTTYGVQSCLYKIEDLLDLIK